MKLLVKTGLLIVTVALFVFFFGGIAYYKIIQSIFINYVDKSLKEQKTEILAVLSTHADVDKLVILHDKQLNIHKIKDFGSEDEILKDTVLLDSVENLYMPMRMYRFKAKGLETNYEVRIFSPMVEAEKLIAQTVLTMTLMLITFIIAMLIFNRYFFRRIWDDFFISLSRAKEYNLRDNPILDLKNSDVEEFQILNDVLKRLTERIHKDYQNLKEFTENASHEIQTPLSVMKAKTELLMQDESCTPKQLELISELNIGISRLSNINKVLILMTRIDNEQFTDLTKIDLKERLEYHLNNFSDIIESKEIEVDVNIKNSIVMQMNSALADILIINLLKNAIRHNFEKGKIFISLDSKAMVISNTGPDHQIKGSDIFNRFVKSNNVSESQGLGLSLVRKVCHVNKFKIHYDYKNEIHTMTVDFRRN
jgi:signal transduction histidine kinase